MVEPHSSVNVLKRPYEDDRVAVCFVTKRDVAWGLLALLVVSVVASSHEFKVIWKPLSLFTKLFGLSQIDTFSICKVIWIILHQNLRHFVPLRPERVAFCTRANLFVEPRARLRFSPFEQHLCCSLGERPVIWWRKIDCK